MASGSSSARTISESKHISMRGGASPLLTKVFSVLKVSGLWLNTQLGGEKLNVPPFGASRFT